MLTLHPITSEDIPDCVRIQNAAFGTTLINRALWPKGVPSEAIPILIAQDRHTLATKRNIHWFCAHDSSFPSNPIIAVAKWRLEDAETFDEPKKEDPPVPGSNEAAGAMFFGAMGRNRKETNGRRTYWHLQILVTDPEFQGRGAGRLLVEWGVRRAEREGLDVWIDATDGGKGLYEKVGCKTVKVLKFDLGEFGVEGEMVMDSMIKKAGSVGAD